LPQQKFQLIVMSEFLYYLDPAALQQVFAWLHTSLEPGGCFLSCHWRCPFVGFSLNGVEVHRQLKVQLKYKHNLSVQDSDFLVDLWLNSAQSVAEQEGLK